MQPDTPDEKGKTKRKNDAGTRMTFIQRFAVVCFAVLTVPVFTVVGYIIIIMSAEAKTGIPRFLIYNLYWIPLCILPMLVSVCVVIWSALFAKWREVGCLLALQVLGFCGACSLLWVLLPRGDIQSVIDIGDTSYILRSIPDLTDLFVCKGSFCNGTTIEYPDSMRHKGTLNIVRGEYLKVSIEGGDIYCYPLAAINQDITYANYQLRDLDRTCPPAQ